MGKTKTKTLLWLILLFCSFAAEAVSVIGKIQYQGNEVTQPSVMSREIYIHTGDEFNDALVEKSRRAIMDLNLFKSVYYYLEEDYTNGTNDKGGYRVNVIFIVKEKYFLLVLPKLKINDNEKYYGIQLRWDNIGGLNHRAKVQAEDRGSTAGVDESRYFLRYFYPNVNGSNYNLNLDLQTQNDVDESEGLVDRQDQSYQIGITKWINERGRSRGWFVGGDVRYQKRINDDLLDSANSEQVNAVVLGADVGYRNLNNFKYKRGGKAYGYRLDVSHENIGSETAFTKHQFYYRSYYQFKKHPYANLNVQMKFGHSNNKVLGEYAFKLGSGNDLRGYEKNRFLGNTLFVTNMEYMLPRENHPSLRYVTFVDVGNTYDKLDDVLHEPLNVGAGLGLRWKVRSLVRIDLRVDVGYGFTDGDYKFNFGTRHTF